MTLFRHSMAYCSDLLTLTRTIHSFSAAAVVLRLLVLTVRRLFLTLFSCRSRSFSMK